MNPMIGPGSRPRPGGPGAGPHHYMLGCLPESASSHQDVVGRAVTPNRLKVTQTWSRVPHVISKVHLHHGVYPGVSLPPDTSISPDRVRSLEAEGT